MWMSESAKEYRPFWKGLIGLITQGLGVSVNDIWKDRNGDQIETCTDLIGDDVRQELRTGLKDGRRYDKEHAGEHRFPSSQG
jgi:hypothetical protein